MHFKKGDIVTTQEYYGECPIRPQAVGVVLKTCWSVSSATSQPLVGVMWFEIEWDRVPCMAHYETDRIRLHCNEI